jgi:hypothetical protein
VTLTLVEMQSVIEDVTADMPQYRVTDGQTNGSNTVAHTYRGPREVIECSNAALHHVRTDAETILQPFNDLKLSKPRRFLSRLQWTRKRWKFALKGGKIHKLIQVVQAAKSNLKLALEIALLCRNESG